MPYLRSQISIFVVRCLDSTMSIVAASEIPRLSPAFEAQQVSLRLTWAQIPEDRFSRDVAQLCLCYWFRSEQTNSYVDYHTPHYEPRHDKTKK